MIIFTQRFMGPGLKNIISCWINIIPSLNFTSVISLTHPMNLSSTQKTVRAETVEWFLNTVKNLIEKVKSEINEEREKMTQLLNHGFIDTYRYLYPLQEGVYSWWSYRFKAREKNAGWRIDYFIVSDSLKDKIIDATIETEIMGSDHCPVTLTTDL